MRSWLHRRFSCSAFLKTCPVAKCRADTIAFNNMINVKALRIEGLTKSADKLLQPFMASEGAVNRQVRVSGFANSDEGGLLGYRSLGFFEVTTTGQAGLDKAGHSVARFRQRTDCQAKVPQNQAPFIEQTKPVGTAISVISGNQKA